jgi:pyruvate dehydrogenase E2 component (dihydrolipoyllysine-residue acetyltransferase)
MAQFEFKLPDIGEGVVEGEIVKWLVKPGDQIVEDQPLVEVMTDKATVTIPSPRRGKVLQTFGKEGDIAKVHSTLVVLDLDGEGASQATPTAGVPAQAAPSVSPEQAGQPAPLQTANVPQPQAGASAHGAQTSAHASRNGDGHKVLATPVTRRMAREMGVDLSALQGSGPQGRVMKADVLAHAENKSRPPPQAPPPRMQALAQDEVRPLRGLRKSIAKSMVQSHTYVVPFTFVEECDTSALTSLRERINAELARRGETKLSYLPFIAKALLNGFDRYPDLNAVMDEEKQALVVKKDVNLGFGAATEQGLTVFVVKDVRSKTIREIGSEIDRLAKAAREHKLQLHDLQGSTFTVTSLGRDGGLMATPVVKHPEVAILGIHKIKEYARPVRRGDGSVGVEIAERMNLSCSFDHRVIDGHIGAAFLYEVIHALEAPELLLLDQI